MQVRTDTDLRVVTVRHSASDLALRGLVLVGAGIGLPAGASATAPGLVVPALVATLASALWLVRGLTAVLVLDDDGVAVSASRRGRRHLPWDEVAGIHLADGRLTVTTLDGRTVTGPPGDDALLADARRHAARLGLLPPRLR
jgi:hypothetical protein